MSEHVKSICKIGQRAKCCRYLLFGSNGFECAKLDANMRALLDARVLTGQMTAVGDNCDGQAALREAEDAG